MWIELLLIILPELLELLKECIDEEGKEKVIHNLQHMPALIQWPVYRKARETGATIIDSRECAKEAWKAFCTLKESDVDFLIAQCDCTDE